MRKKKILEISYFNIKENQMKNLKKKDII